MEKLSARAKLFYGTLLACGVHMVLFLQIAKTSDLRTPILGTVALVITGALYILHITKRTMPFEEQFPSWLYFGAAVLWAINTSLTFAGLLT